MDVTLTARWIFPVDQPPLAGGTITVHGEKIVAVERHGVSKADIDLGDAAIVPGFVNAHTHLDLTEARGRIPVAGAPGYDFTQWLRQVIAYRRSRTLEQTQADIAAGLAECIKHGAMLIGDIASADASWELLAKAPCRSVVFRELLGLTEERAEQSLHELQHWLDRHITSEQCAVGVSPHAPYSVRRTQYSVLGTQSLPVATHLAETLEELELLHHHRGAFLGFLKELNAWDASGLVANPHDVMCVLPRGIFIHGNYLDPATSFLPTQSLVVCPRTHAAFGHPHHPFPKMNVRVALGTDSLASNPDLDIWAEARFLAWHYPEVPFSDVLKMVTLNGAVALRFGDVTGSLTPCKSADLVVLPISGTTKYEEPHGCLFDPKHAATPAKVMFRGAWRV